MRRGPLARSLAALLLAASLARPHAARAGDAPADTTLEGYVRAMSDSTDAWFGLTAQPADTTGLDSLRAYVLAHPRARRTSGGRVSLTPWIAFNRVLGLAPGAGAGLGTVAGTGRVTASAQWAPGPDLWLGSGSVARSRADATEAHAWSVRAQAGREVGALDRDDYAPGVSLLRALLFGNDHTHYLRLDGARLELERSAPGWSAGLAARDQLESPMATTATWYLGGRHLEVERNDPATLARVHELGAWGVVRLPGLPYRLDAHAWRAGAGLGGDVAYTRLRASVGGGLALGRRLTLATQAEWGRLTGAALPQEAFYLGGPTLYTVRENGLQGTGRTVARAELLLDDPLQRLLGLGDSPTFPLQLGAFAGSAARWGFDPLTGRAALTARDWPERAAWRSEAGVSVLYRPGLPDPDSFARVALAWPLGPGGRRAAVVVTYTRALNLLRH